MRAFRRLGRWLWLPLIGWLAACATVAPTPTQSEAILLTDCTLSASNGAQVQARCGTLAVPEDWADPSGNTINLNIAVVPSVSRNPRPDPVMPLTGGPGQAITEAYPLLSFAFDRLAADREIVLVDQRGTGGSHPLQCTEFESNQAALTTPTDEVIAELQACPAKLNTDPNLYTTDDAVRDLEAVRAALGYEQVNLYGASYGTRLALAYLQAQPSRVRTVVLDAVVSPDYVLFQNAPQDGQHALDSMFARCEADEACNGAFPELRTEFAGLHDSLAEQPMAVKLPDPVTGETLDFDLTPDAFNSFVFNVLYSPEGVSLLPLAIHSAATNGDFAPLVGLAVSSDAGIYDGLFYAVACAEDAPLLPAGAVADSAFGDMGASFRQVCQAWPSEAEGSFREPFTSDVPALLLSGEADPITPPQYAEEVAAFLPNSLSVVAPGMGHGVFIRGCIPSLVAQFVDDGSTGGLDPSCVADIQPPPFFVRPTGPEPR